LVVGLTTLPRKNSVTETRSVDNETTLTRGVTAGVSVKLMGQSQPEAQRIKSPIVDLKQQMIIGSWNMRTMAETTWEEQIAKDMKEYEIKVLGINETRWKGSDQ